MPDYALQDELHEDIPEFNQSILDGLAYRDLGRAKEEIDQYIACAEPGFPDNFSFIKSSVCSVPEAIQVMSTAMSRSDRGQPSIDLATSDVYLVKYEFMCDGVRLIPRYFFLPYARRGSLTMIAGKQFGIGTVLMDPGLSIGPDYVFIRMSRAPVTFKQTIQTMRVNGEFDSNYVAWSWLHNSGGAHNKTGQSDTLTIGKAVSTLPHYLFCRYGMAETFRKFARAEVELAKIDVPDDMLPEDVPAEIRRQAIEQGYDLDKWTVVTSAHAKPAALKTKTLYRTIKSPIALMIPKDRTNSLTMSYARAFFLTIDLFPEVEDMYEWMGDERWKISLGYILFGDQLGTGKLVENIESHLTSLDYYVDIEVRKLLLEEEGLRVDTIYELFNYILENIERLIRDKEEDIGSMYGKRLVTSQYVLRDITEQIFRCLFEITNNKKRKHGVEDYNKILGRWFMPTIIFNLRKTSQKAFMSSVSTPGDNMFFKITSRLVMQAQTSGGKKPTNINVNDPLSRMHASRAECGNYGVLPKNYPLACATINPTTKLDGKNTIVRKEHLRPVIEHIDDAVSRN